MKKIFLVLSLFGALAGCHRVNTIADDLSRANPIMPIRMSGDTMHIVLTDYIPALYGDTSLWDGLQWTAGESLECINMAGTQPVVREMDIINRNRTMHALTFCSSQGCFAIPVLPNKPVRQALISLGYENDKLRVGFYDKVTNPSFEAYIQNTLIDHSLWHEAEEGTWTLDAASIYLDD